MPSPMTIIDSDNKPIQAAWLRWWSMYRTFNLGTTPPGVTRTKEDVEELSKRLGVPTGRPVQDRFRTLSIWVLGFAPLPGLVLLSIPGEKLLAPLVFMALLWVFVIVQGVLARPRDENARRVETALGEGFCGGCLSDLTSAETTGNKKRCPNCGAAWSTSRLSTLHLIAAMGSAGDANWRDNPQVVDERGRYLRLVSGQRFGAPKPETSALPSAVQGAEPGKEPPEKLHTGQIEIAKEALQEGRSNAVALFAFMTVAMLSSAVLILTGRVFPSLHPDGPWYWLQLALRGYVAILAPYALILQWKHLSPRIRGWQPAKPQEAAAKLAAIRVCPCCADALPHTTEPDGAMVCSRCGGAWKANPRALLVFN
jgi:hypothetical protein